MRAGVALVETGHLLVTLLGPHTLHPDIYEQQWTGQNDINRLEPCQREQAQRRQERRAIGATSSFTMLRRRSVHHPNRTARELTR
jgi:hypothetical protein